jgi:hypothetical protein
MVAFSTLAASVSRSVALGDDVAGDIDEVGVVAVETDQRVGAGQAVEGVVAGGADDRIVVGAGDVEVDLGERPGTVKEDDGLDVAEGDVFAGTGKDETGVGGVRAGPRVVGEVAEDDQCVGIGTAIDGVEPRAGRQRIRAGAADQGVVAEPADEAVVAHAAVEAVVASCAVEGVVTGSTREAVGRRVAGQRIVLGIADEIDAGRGVDNRRVLDVGRQGVGAARAKRELDAVASCRRRLADGIAEDVEPVDVVACSANQAVGALAAIEHVVAGVADQGVVAGQPAEAVVAGAAGQLVVAGVAGAGER